MKITLCSLGIFLLACFLTVPKPVASAPNRADTAAECSPPPPLVTHFGERIVQQKIFTATNSPVPVSRLGAKYLRIRLSAMPSTNCRWYLTVRDRMHRVLQVLTPDDFRVSNTRWTVRVPGDRAYLDLQACPGPNFPDIKSEEFIAMPDKSSNTLYSAEDPNIPKWIDLYNSDSLAQKQAGDATGLLISSHGSETWAGSGVMIAPDLFLTNWHNGKPNQTDYPDSKCWNEEIFQRTIVDLSWDTDGISREYSVVEVMAKDKDLDFAILRLQPITSLGEPRPATLRDAPATNGLPLFVIHHPLGLRKQITLNRCVVTNASYPSWVANSAGTDFTHQCDTEGGSSGAPVFNLNGELIGLHHRGYSRASNANCELDKQNKAVHISKILSFLRSDPSLSPLISKLRLAN